MGKYTLQQIREENMLTKERASRIEDICFRYSSFQEINSFEEFLIVISSLSPQSKSPLIEDFLSRRNNLEKVSPSIEKGDFKTPEGKYIELKVSFSNKEDNLNIRQIRLYQDIDEYWCFYFDDKGNLKKNSKLFILSKEQMSNEVNKIGSFTHGTKRANSENKNNEYSITIPMKKYHYWNKEYKKDIIWGD